MSHKEKTRKIIRPSLSALFTIFVAVIVLVTSVISVYAFARTYEFTMKQNAVTSSEQSVAQVLNMVSDYTEDMEMLMKKIRESIQKDKNYESEYIQSLVKVREDVVSVII